ncbi:MAG TPA: hypothetical protein VMJ12_11400 [Candidatus Acidoferrales bacterium]|nr:hypothetical protein [Candidatus Acidoferrales bacterium]
MKKILILIAALLIGGSAPTAFAQIANEGLAMKIIAARQADAALLKQYSWSSRAELIDNGKVEDTRINLVSYGPDGQLQRTLVNDQAAPLPSGFLRKKIAEDERAKVEKYFAALGKLLDQYTLPSAGKVIDFVSQAQISAPDANGLLQVAGSNVLSPGDTYTMWINASTRHVTKILINTTYEQDAVQLTASYATLKAGLTHLQYAEVTVPAKQLTLQVHNFDYNSNN